MSGRRRSSRYLVQDSHGVLRVVRDAFVQRVDNGELVAISDEPARAGELLTIEFVDDLDTRADVRVVTSRPVMVGRAVRHEVRVRRRTARRKR